MISTDHCGQRCDHQCSNIYLCFPRLPGVSPDAVLAAFARDICWRKAVALAFFFFLLSAAAFLAFAVWHASLQPVTIFVQARDHSVSKVSDDTIQYRESGTIYCMYRVTGI